MSKNKGQNESGFFVSSSTGVYEFQINKNELGKKEKGQVFYYFDRDGFEEVINGEDRNAHAFSVMLAAEEKHPNYRAHVDYTSVPVTHVVTDPEQAKEFDQNKNRYHKVATVTADEHALYENKRLNLTMEQALDNGIFDYFSARRHALDHKDELLIALDENTIVKDINSKKNEKPYEFLAFTM